VEISHRCL